MTRGDKPPSAGSNRPKSPQALRLERLAAALRANLGKRKALVRAKQAPAVGAADRADKSK